MPAPPAFRLLDAEWLAHRFVEGEDRFRFVHVPRADHAGIPFLTDARLGPRPTAPDVPTGECLALPGEGLHFLFHSAFCGSTMLVRGLARPGLAMGLSEPVVLNDLVGFRRRGAPPPAVARAADAATRLLARPFAPGEAVIVKPSNILNPLAALLLALRPESQAVFLHAPLETFLISVARKGLECRLWVRELLQGYWRDGVVQFGFSLEDLFGQSDLQIAALGWLAQHRIAHDLARRAGPRLATLDSDRMLADPVRAIGAIARHYRLPLDSARAAEIAAGPAFSRHSKSGEAYSPEARAADYAQVRAAHGEEIGHVLAWAARVAEAQGIAMALPHPLA